MNNGKVEQIGNAYDIYHKPINKFVAVMEKLEENLDENLEEKDQLLINNKVN